jgi:hypothetical protein
MNSTAKVLIPNKEWLIRNESQKIGSISKQKKGYSFIKNGKQVNFKSLADINAQFGIAIFEENIKKARTDAVENKNYVIYDFPCNSKPHNPVYNVKKKIPLFAKGNKSKSQYCAGYYIIKFRKGWVKSFCPKLITLERYPFRGPVKLESELKTLLNNVNKA